MRRFHHPTLLAFLFFLIGGCNSHASFENETCRNDRLDEGEECDETPDGIATFNGMNTCETALGLPGDLKCTTQCELDTTGCREGDPCDPFDNTACDPEGNVYCYFFHEGPFTDCQETGANRAEGQPCGSPTDCAFGLTCYGDFCHQLCTENSQCAISGICEKIGWINGYGFCSIFETSCDPFENQGCDEFFGCYFKDWYGNSECRLEGQIGEEGPCDVNNNCQPGHVCSRSTLGILTCSKLCREDSDCDDGTCDLVGAGLEWGICLFNPQGEGCSLLYDTVCPSYGMTCQSIHDESEPVCLTPGGAAVGETCGVFSLCQAGLFCEYYGDSRCHRLCESEMDCDGAACDSDPDAPESYKYCQE